MPARVSTTISWPARVTGRRTLAWLHSQDAHQPPITPVTNATAARRSQASALTCGQGWLNAHAASARANGSTAVPSMALQTLALSAPARSRRAFIRPNQVQKASAISARPTPRAKSPRPLAGSRASASAFTANRPVPISASEGHSRAQRGRKTAKHDKARGAELGGGEFRGKQRGGKAQAPHQAGGDGKQDSGKHEGAQKHGAPPGRWPVGGASGCAWGDARRVNIGAGTLRRRAAVCQLHLWRRQGRQLAGKIGRWGKAYHAMQLAAIWRQHDDAGRDKQAKALEQGLVFRPVGG